MELVDEVVFFIDRPIELRLDKGGIVRAEFQSGSTVIHLATTIPVFIESFARAALLAHQWRANEEGDVVELADYRRTHG